MQNGGGGGDYNDDQDLISYYDNNGSSGEGHSALTQGRFHDRRSNDRGGGRGQQGGNRGGGQGGNRGGDGGNRGGGGGMRGGGGGAGGGGGGGRGFDGSRTSRTGQGVGRETEAASDGTVPVYTLGTHNAYGWSGKTKHDDKTLTKAPLLSAMKAKNLSVDEQFNMKALYVKSAKNTSQFPVGVQITGVNGQALNHFTDDVGQHYAYPLLPGESLNFAHLGDGNGLKIAGNELDQHAAVNVRMSMQEMQEFQKPGPDEDHVVVDVDLSGFADKNNATPAATLNPLAKVLIANSRALLTANKPVRMVVGNRLDPDTEADRNAKPLFQTYDIKEAQWSKKPGDFQVLVDKASLDHVLEKYDTKVKETAAKTSAKDYNVKIIRLNHKPETGKAFGDLTGEHGVTPSDIERANSGTVISGVHLVLVHEIQHNGKPFGASPTLTASTTVAEAKK